MLSLQRRSSDLLWQVYFVPRRRRRRDGRAGFDPQPFDYGGARKGRGAMFIYGSVVSPFVRKLLGYLGEKGIEFELKGVGIGDPDPGFQAASPLGKMPAMDDDGFLLADSSAIIHYLEAKHPEDRKSTRLNSSH